jgi:hypothetical protein
MLRSWKLTTTTKIKAHPRIPRSKEIEQFELLSEQLVPVGKQRKEDGSHMIRSERDNLTGLEPLDELAFGNSR